MSSKKSYKSRWNYGSSSTYENVSFYPFSTLCLPFLTSLSMENGGFAGRAELQTLGVGFLNLTVRAQNNVDWIDFFFRPMLTCFITYIASARMRLIIVYST